MKKHFFSFLVLTGFVIFSCTTAEIPLDEEVGPIDEVVTYVGDVKAIIDKQLYHMSRYRKSTSRTKFSDLSASS